MPKSNRLKKWRNIVKKCKKCGLTLANLQLFKHLAIDKTIIQFWNEKSVYWIQMPLYASLC